tara:strand:+ start:4143 stop:4712 length:570 start_codon:yes stop_codon:yes gene_type:complete
MLKILFITEDITPTSEGKDKEESLIRRIFLDVVNFNDNSKEPLHVLIDTDGGSLKTALSIYDILKSFNGPIYTYALSEVSSAGVLIYLAGERRYAFPHSQFMTHPSSLSVSGTDAEFDSSVSIVKQQTKKGDKVYKKVLGLTSKEVQLMHRDTMYMWGKDAKKKKIVTHIINKLPSEFIYNNNSKSESQ